MMYFDDAMVEMGPLDDDELGPVDKRDGKLEVIILMTWWGNFGALDGAMENLGPFAFWKRNGEIGNH